MKPVVYLSLALLASCASYQPTREVSFATIAGGGCGGDDQVIVRGQVGNATENSFVLTDPSEPTSSIAVSLPGRGVLARLKGMVGTNKYEESREVLTRLKADGSPVTVTLNCEGNAAPTAHNLSYTNPDGSRSLITF
jgi:hypothetical protein